MGFTFNPFTGKLDMIRPPVAGSVEYPDDILNNQVTPEAIAGMAINGASNRSAVFTYQIYRRTDSSSRVESGTVIVNYNTDANAWAITRTGTLGDAGVTMSIAAGQVKYISDNMSGDNYSGHIKFKRLTLGVEL